MKLIHYSKKGIYRVFSVEQFGFSSFKPEGLWVCCGKKANNWRDHSLANNLTLGNIVYDVRLQETANILLINSSKSFKKFDARFSDNESIRWKDVAVEYQGIIISPYQDEFRYNGWYFGWDFASGCIWDAKAISSIAKREAKMLTIPKPSPTASSPCGLGLS